jgi:hypothetical protein
MLPCKTVDFAGEAIEKLAISPNRRGLSSGPSKPRLTSRRNNIR